MLPPESLPLPLSLRERVVQRLAAPPQGSAIMRERELREYLEQLEDCELSPLDAVLARAEQIGDPVAPSSEDGALLRWVGDAFALWESRFALEPQLQAQLRQLKLVAARLAVLDNSFATPGAHPLHTLLDTLHDVAIGWQPDLGRVGEPITRLVEQTVADLTAECGEDADTLSRLAAAATESGQRLLARSARMVQRAADVERARLRASRAKVSAAQMINAALASTPLPPAVGHFLVEPWFDSAQLVLLKFGTDAEQWQAMERATWSLVRSLAEGPAQGDEGARAVEPESAGRVCRELRQWLFSMQHDSAAAAEMVGEIEYTLLRALRGETLQKSPITPIEIAEHTDSEAPVPAELAGAQANDWFRLRTGRGSYQRLQIALRQDQQHSLLFSGPSGQQVRSMDFAEFARGLQRGDIVPLPSGASFSRALAAAAGVDAAADLDNLGAATARPAAAPAPARAAAPAPTPAPPGPSAPPAPAQPEASQPAPSPPAPSPPAPAKPTPAKPAPAQSAAAPASTPAATRSPASRTVDEEYPLPPLGTWLGFHDVDPPLLAKLAMYDAVRHLLIFVNRKGIEQRRLEEDDYQQLVQEGQVDILEARRNFREEVERARRRLEKHGQ
ncbi:DUF1631 family protein [Mangrovimicrobium sediminis]|uniref:DUF1631 family protein n=1 Tax=Mangrovimicrobium sediminis TaxID=2562682 RepID=A0A4Z0M4A1_9GAMM|nr:DUF1631 family protein [Haliea sp. SAOS-164]TGD74286.1 DUF1631 family protein [Haliea sp. SAOS-164]